MIVPTEAELNRLAIVKKTRERYDAWIASRLLPCPYKRPGWRPSAPVTPFGFPTIDRAEWPFENAPK